MWMRYDLVARNFQSNWNFFQVFYSGKKLFRVEEEFFKLRNRSIFEPSNFFTREIFSFRQKLFKKKNISRIEEEFFKPRDSRIN